MRRFLLPVATATAAMIALAGAYTFWKLRSAGVIEIVIGPTAQESMPLLQAWQQLALEQPSPLHLRMRVAKSDEEALALLRHKSASLAAIQLTEKTSNQLRAVAQLRHHVIIRDRSRRSEAIPEFLKRGGGFQKVNLETVIRQKAKPEGIVDAADESLTEEDRILFWYLGATRTASDNAHWHETALSSFQYLVSTELVDKQVIHDVSASFHNAMRDLRRSTPAARAAMLAPISEERSILRAHDGVARFVDRESETFFERYGDWVYIGISALGLIGTVLGALFAMVHFRMRDNGRRHLGRMRRVLQSASILSPPETLARARLIAARILQAAARDIAADRADERIIQALMLHHDALLLLTQSAQAAEAAAPGSAGRPGAIGLDSRQGRFLTQAPANDLSSRHP